MPKRGLVFYAGVCKPVCLSFLLPGQKRSYGHHRCVTPLYRIPMGSFNYVLLVLTKRR